MLDKAWELVNEKFEWCGLSFEDESSLLYYVGSGTYEMYQESTGKMITTTATNERGGHCTMKMYTVGTSTNHAES